MCFTGLKVDPLTAKVVLLCWEEGVYEETVLTGDNAIASALFPELHLIVATILAAGSLG